MILAPIPKNIVHTSESFSIPERGYIYINSKALFEAAKDLKELLPGHRVSSYNGKRTTISIVVDPNVIDHPQGYILKINPHGISIIGGSDAGCFYGMMTLKQILMQSNGKIEGLYVKDHPDFRERGIMIDISRDKVPKLSTLKMLIDILAIFKVNQIQLYTEHTFAYREHEKVWRDYSPLTSEDILELDRYAASKFIELVPNQNSFGHMEKWLVHDEYKHMAEVEDGFVSPWGEKWNHPFSLSPAVKESIEFIDRLYEELLPHFSSDKFNVGCDETFDLCQGKSKELCKRYGNGRVYLDFLMRIYKLVKKHGKTMLFWGDIIKNHPDLVKELPSDVVPLIWGYEADHPFEKECELFSKTGLSFYVCPGTSSWNSIIGRYENMKKNVLNAAQNGRKWGAIGILTTDWGDNGHWQHLPFSIPGMIWGAILGWNVEDYPNLEKVLSLFVFKDKAMRVGEILKDLGNLYLKMEFQVPNVSTIAAPLLWAEKLFDGSQYLEKIRLTTIGEIINDLERAKSTVKKCQISGLGGEIVKDEIINGADMAALSLKIAKVFLEAEQAGIKEPKESEKRTLLDEFHRVEDEFKRLWKARNREGGLRQSLEKLHKILRLFES